MTSVEQTFIKMTGQGYKRTNFDDDDISNGPGTPPGIEFNIPRSAYNSRLSPWKKKTQLERTLIIVVAILTVLLVIFIAVLASKNSESRTATASTTSSPLVYVPATSKAATPAPPPRPTHCLTPRCVQIAGSLLDSMDLAADPCQDFFQYACGGWIEKHPIPSGHSMWGTFSELQRKNQVILRQVIEEPIQKSGSTAKNKAKMYYSSCMDKNKTAEKLGAEPLLDIINGVSSFSFLPASPRPFDPENWNFQIMLEQVHKLGQSVMFNMGVGVDDKDSSRNIIQLDQGGLTLPRDYYINKTDSNRKVLAAYLDFMTKVGVLLGGEYNETRDSMIEIIDFETSLAKISVSQAERRDEEKMYHKTTVSQLQITSPCIDWSNYFHSLFKNVEITIGLSEEVVVKAQTFFGNLTSLVSRMTASPNSRKILNNYMLWHIVNYWYQFLSKPFRDAGKVFNEAISGSSGNEEDWRVCIENTDQILGFALGAMFVKRSFNGDSRDKAEDMVARVRAAFIANLPKLSWMDKETGQKAVQKANGVVEMIGYPKFILNDKKLDKEYENLTIYEDRYFMNNVENSIYSLNKSLMKLRKKPEKDRWDMSPPTINAYYSASENRIVFPAGILQSPFYDQSFPKSLNYGGMGVVMGHELTHGFDDQGCKFDMNGNLKPWWSKEAIRKFKKRTECMVKQYSRYTINEEHIRGKVTLGENIADNGGLKSAYRAYLKLVREQKNVELSLPGLNLTHRQLFFVGFARVWCSKSTKEANRLQIHDDSHSPAKFRVIGTLSNSRQFSKEFKCRAGSPMNPRKKCEVW